jgi:ubiquinone/menaquinone biosynthesis C-methylase UbiE
MFHELADKKMLVDECRRIIRQGGSLTLVDFQKRPTVMGPPMEERVPEEEVESWFAGFSVDRKASLQEFYQFEFIKG